MQTLQRFTWANKMAGAGGDQIGKVGFVLVDVDYILIVTQLSCFSENWDTGAQAGRDVFIYRSVDI